MTCPTEQEPRRAAPAPLRQVRAWCKAPALAVLEALPSWLRPRVPTDTWVPGPDVAGPPNGRMAAIGRAALTAVVVLAVGGLLIGSVPEAHAQAGVLDSVQNQYAAITRTWLGPMVGIGRRLFVKLAAIEFVISGMLWLGRGDDLTETARRFLLKFILVRVVLMVLTSAGYWLPPVVRSLAFAGRSAGVLPTAAGPSEILDLGLAFAFDDIGNVNIPWSFEALAAVLFKLITQVLVLLCFAAVAAQLLLVWVESYIALGGGVLFLGFGGFRATAPYAENYLNYLVYCGVKLFVFYLVVGLGTAIVQQARVTFVSNVGFDVKAMGSILALTVTFALISTRVPSNAAARIAGGAHLGLSQALRSL